MRALLTTAVITATLGMVNISAAQEPDNIVLAIESFVVGNGVAVVNLSAKNNTAASTKNVMVECGFVSDDNKILNVGYHIFQGIKPNDTGSEELVAFGDQRMKRANCRVFSIF